MPQSLAFVLVHIIFSTKDRAPLITSALQPELHAYLSTVARNVNCECYRTGGVEDHVHLAIRLARTIKIAELIEELKTSSSKWIKTKAPGLQNFAWQKGYGAFSLSPNDREDLIKYIDRQKEHHEKVTFQEEYRRYLQAYGMDFDERYVWD